MSYKRGSEEVKCMVCNEIVLMWPYAKNKINSLTYKCKKCFSVGKKIVNCEYCNKKITKISTSSQKFCSRSCSASFHNALRPPMADIQKEKISSTLKKQYADGSISHTQMLRKSTIIHLETCTGCGITFVRACAKGNVSHKTCGLPICRSMASVGNRTYPNGRRKLFEYFNKHQNKKVLLESSWELKMAEFLDKHDIFWIRPKPLEWFDSHNKRRHYYPDFYLKDFELYVDPKNPWTMEKDKEKLKYFEGKINLVVGDIKTIISQLENILSLGS